MTDERIEMKFIRPYKHWKAGDVGMFWPSEVAEFEAAAVAVRTNRQWTLQKPITSDRSVTKAGRG